MLTIRFHSSDFGDSCLGLFYELDNNEILLTLDQSIIVQVALAVNFSSQEVLSLLPGDEIIICV